MARKTEVKAFSMDRMTEEDLEYLIGSHYCNQLGLSDLVCGLIKHAAAEARVLDRMQSAGEVTVPQGWYGGVSGLTVAVTA